MEITDENCPCKRVKCERHGNCQECRQHHIDSPNKNSVYCERVKDNKSREDRRNERNEKEKIDITI